MLSKKTVSVVLAGYNEKNNIKKSMETIYQALSSAFETWELILVDDASKDNTNQLMKEFSKQHNNVLFLENVVNLNFGTSVLRGLLAAQYDYIVYNACDLPLKVEDMVNLILEMDEETDVLVMERKSYKTTFWRRITSDVNKTLLHILYPRLTKGTPVLNFVQIYRKRIIKDIIPFARSPIFVWPELIFRAKVKNLNVVNVPVDCDVQNLRKGAFGHPHDIMWGVYEMLRFRIRLWRKDI